MLGLCFPKSNILMLGHTSERTPYMALAIGCFTWNNVTGIPLYGYFYPIAFGVEDYTFVIPVAGSAGLPYDGDSVFGHLLGQAVHVFFRTDGKGKMGKTEMFHVKHS